MAWPAYAYQRYQHVYNSKGGWAYLRTCQQHLAQRSLLFPASLHTNQLQTAPLTCLAARDAALLGSLFAFVFQMSSWLLLRSWHLGQMNRTWHPQTTSKQLDVAISALVGRHWAILLMVVPAVLTMVAWVACMGAASQFADTWGFSVVDGPRASIHGAVCYHNSYILCFSTRNARIAQRKCLCVTLPGFPGC